jgi:hypothetical protein
MNAVSVVGGGVSSVGVIGSAVTLCGSNTISGTVCGARLGPQGVVIGCLVGSCVDFYGSCLLLKKGLNRIHEAKYRTRLNKLSCEAFNYFNDAKYALFLHKLAEDYGPNKRLIQSPPR